MTELNSPASKKGTSEAEGFVREVPVGTKGDGFEEVFIQCF